MLRALQERQEKFLMLEVVIVEFTSVGRRRIYATLRALQACHNSILITVP